MNKIVGFNKIGYVAATFEVDKATQTYLKTNHLNTKTGNVDVNGLNLAVKLGEDGKVGFGTGTEADALLGFIISYEMDGFASIQIAGGLDEVPTAAELKAGRKALAVDAAGKVVEVEGAREATVAIPSTSENLLASVIL